MAAPLNTCTTIEQRGDVRFLWAKNMDILCFYKSFLTSFCVLINVDVKVCFKIKA
jgi:hypothetical protein